MNCNAKIVKDKIIIGQVPQDYNDAYNIVLCLDSKVSVAVGVLLYSVLKQNKGRFVFHLFLKDSFTEDTVLHLRALADKHKCTVIIYHIDDERITGLYYVGCYSDIIFYKLLVPQVLHELKIKKSLFLDVDMLCIRPIIDIFSLDIKNYGFYAVEDTVLANTAKDERNKELGIPQGRYFNAGVLLINIERFVCDDYCSKVIAKVTENKLLFAEQDALNIVVGKQVLYDTNPKYNWLVLVSEEDKQDIALVHFAGFQKPWKLYTVNYHKYATTEIAWREKYYQLWRETCAASPWGKEPDIYELPQKPYEWRYLAHTYYKSGTYTKMLWALWHGGIGKIRKQMHFLLSTQITRLNKDLMQ